MTSLVPPAWQHQEAAQPADRWHGISHLVNPCGSSRHPLTSERTATGYRLLSKRSEGKKLWVQMEPQKREQVDIWMPSVMTSAFSFMFCIISSLWVWARLTEIDYYWSNRITIPRLGYKYSGFLHSCLLTLREASCPVVKTALWKDSCGKELGKAPA